MNTMEPKRQTESGKTETTTSKELPIRQELDEQVKTVGRDLRLLGRLAGVKVRNKAVVARERAGDLFDRVRFKSRRTIENRPLASLAAAAGVGALAGLLLGRK